MVDPQAGFNKIGTPMTKGVCSVCGTKMVRMGRTEAHEGLVAPAKSPRDLRKGKLVIVESPAKARTVSRFLGKGYTVRASVGHVRDLLRSQLSVDVDNDFAPKYRVPNEKREIVKELKKLAKKSKEIYLATDPDREGEAIAWHLIEAAEINPELAQRVVFHEITQQAVSASFAQPRKLNTNLVDAQQARRVLDRLVGYSISPILWKKVRSRLSAGRVQSVALRLVAEREEEIDAFNPVEYWTIKAELKPENGDISYQARLVRIDDEEPTLRDESIVKGILDDLERAKYIIKKIKHSERRRKPAAPFITSSLQQEASRRLGYTTKRTMALAQQLYEGLDVGNGGGTGLITYMRTDSMHISEVAQNEVRNYIENVYGKEYLPSSPPKFRTRVVAAQEAHEAIRPTSVLRNPKEIKTYLTRDQYRLYNLIWQRFVASQMEAAIYDTISVQVIAESHDHKYLLRASGSTLRFSGFLVVYEESKDEDEKKEGAEDTKIPDGLSEGQLQHLVRLIPEQHFTQPPPRFTEATLIRLLEEHGIGRPSTYAPTVSTIQQRGYVYREDKRLFPTDTGILVNNLVVKHFPDIVDLGFTAGMENNLDKIAAGDRAWNEVVKDFYSKFYPEVERAIKEMPEAKVDLEKIGRECPKCGNDLVIRWGRYGKFISCSTFPECRHTEPWLEKIGVDCPDCDGEIVLRKSRNGRTFYGCSEYPECEFRSWKRPVRTLCPNCSGTLVIANKREYKCLGCEETFLIEQTEPELKEK
jgi:DNA topoisomerase I